MPTLFCLGVGYVAQHYLAHFGHRFDCIQGTVRTHAKAAQLAAAHKGLHRPDIMIFDGVRPSPKVTAALGRVDFLLVTAAPTSSGDPFIAVLDEVLAQVTQLKSIVYLSSASVYGDHGGGLVDETSTLVPASERGRLRVAAEFDWIALGKRIGRPATVLRLSGIYGPGRNILDRLERGEAVRMTKPGQVFNRIHITDVAHSIDAAFTQRVAGVFNVTDDEASPPEDVVAFAADLMGVPVPAIVSFADAPASMSAMSRSFYQENKRLLNYKLKMELGIKLVYPTYREGLQALYQSRGK